MIRDLGSGFRSILGQKMFTEEGLGLRTEGSGFRVQGSGFRVNDFGVRV